MSAERKRVGADGARGGFQVVLTKAQKKAAKKRSNEAATKAAKSDALRQAKLARVRLSSSTIPSFLTVVFPLHVR